MKFLPLLYLLLYVVSIGTSILVVLYAETKKGLRFGLCLVAAGAIFILTTGLAFFFTSPGVL